MTRARKRSGQTSWWCVADVDLLHVVAVLGAAVVLVVLLVKCCISQPISTWNTNQWIRVFQVMWMMVVAVVYTWSLVEIVWHLKYEPRRRRVTRFERRIHVGRALRQISILWFAAGATHSALTNFDSSLSFRSLAWVFGCFFAFLAWTMLDRRRWDVGLT